MPIRVFVMAEEPSAVDPLVRAVSWADDLELAGTALANRAGLDLMREVSRTYPDVVLLDLCTGGPPAFQVLSQLGEQLINPPKVLAMAPADREDLVVRSIGRGAAYCVMKPFDTDTLLLRLRQLATEDVLGCWQCISSPLPDRVERAVAEVLSSLGVPQHLKGYTYLVAAIAAVVRNPELIGSVTQRLYPLVAVRCHSTPRRVERAIRTCIEAAWLRGNLTLLDGLFAHQIDAERGKPTNASFIARIAAEVRIKRYRGGNGRTA